MIVWREPLPVAFGAAAQTLELDKAQVIALYLHAFASNLVSVAVRFVPLGQNEGQAALAALHPMIQSLGRCCRRAGGGRYRNRGLWG